MHYLRIQVCGPIAKRYAERIDGAVRVANLTACERPDPDGVTFEVLASDEELEPLLYKLWSMEPMGSSELQMSCHRIKVEPDVDPGSGPRTAKAGLVTCEECRSRR